MLIENESFIKSLYDLLFKPKVLRGVNKWLIQIKEEILTIIINIISYGDNACIEYFLSLDIILSIRKLLTNYDYSPTLYYCCMLIIEKLLSYQELSESRRNNIIRSIISLDFHNIFETIYFKYKNNQINKIIERILNMCKEQDYDQMMI